MAVKAVRVAALGDTHCTRTAQGAFQPLFSRIAETADILLIAGDLTDYGLPDEARVLATQHTTLLHYSPIQKTVDGEPLEIYPFLGSSRLEEPIGRYPVSLVLHGHAHRGQLEGTTQAGVPVYNVSMPLLKRSFADQPPFRVFEVPIGQPAIGETPPAYSTSTLPAMREVTAAAPRGRRSTDAVAS